AGATGGDADDLAGAPPGPERVGARPRGLGARRGERPCAGERGHAPVRRSRAAGRQRIHARRRGEPACRARVPPRERDAARNRARDELRVEVDNLRAAAEWAVIQWSEDDARAALASLQVFFWAHSWHEGSETFAQLADLLESSPGGPLDAEEASDVSLSALAYQTYLGSALGYDEKLDATARACLPVLRARKLTRELGVC